MRRFFISRDSISGNRLSIQGREAHHIAVVLRLQPGDEVVVFDGSEREYLIALEDVSPTEVAGRIIETRPALRPIPHLVLMQGVPKGAKMDDVVRMGTELGIAEFVPFLSSRTVAEGRGRTARWRRIAIEAAKQSRRGDVPTVHEPIHFSAALDLIEGCDLRLILWEGERDRSLAQALADPSNPSRVAIVVGPEGGLAEHEVDEAVRRGAIAVSLGPLVLRTETAGIVATAMVVYELGSAGRRSSSG